jgi:hypothetical protein
MKLLSIKENVKIFEIILGFNYKYDIFLNIIINENNL